MLSSENIDIFIGKESKEFSILYLEDEKMIRESVVKILKRRYSKIYVGEDGEEGLELFSKYNPDIIITDINMPKLSGIEMVKIIRQKNEEIPIIITTAYQNSSLLFEAIEARVDNFLLKPISKTRLLERVDRCSKKLHFQELSKIFYHTTQQMTKGMILVDKSGGILYANPAFLKVSGYSMEEVLESEFVSSSELCKPFQVSESIWKKIVSDENFSDEVLSVQKSNQKYYQARTVTPIKNRHGEISHFLYMSENVTTRREEIDSLQEEATRDALTKTLRRNVLESRIDNFIGKSESLIFAMVDIDYFKRVNDTYGHDKGDFVLRKFAALVLNELRADDLFFRWGGEEFLILFLNQKMENIFKVLERIRQKISLEEFTIDSSLTVSIGVAKLEKNESWLSAVKNADEALYSAKAQGRNRVQEYKV